MDPIKTFWWHEQNFGDLLTPFIVQHVTGRKVAKVSKDTPGKLLCIGSVLHCVAPFDVVVGTGLNRDREIRAPRGARFLSVRGPITRKLIKGAEVPESYGDPALILPLVYNPDMGKVYNVGYLPHYVDKEAFRERFNITKKDLFIDVRGNWKDTIKAVKSCKFIITSSLHGIICAEAYGVPVAWVSCTDQIIGGDLKFQDYFLGTGRSHQRKNRPLQEIPDLPGLQKGIIDNLLKANELLK